jgi:hypothetical protein
MKKLRQQDEAYRWDVTGITFAIPERVGDPRDFIGRVEETVMWGVHDEIRAQWKALARLLAEGPDEDAEARAAPCFDEQAGRRYNPTQRRSTEHPPD